MSSAEALVWRDSTAVSQLQFNLRESTAYNLQVEGRNFLLTSSAKEHFMMWPAITLGLVFLAVAIASRGLHREHMFAVVVAIDDVPQVFKLAPPEK